MRAKEVVVSNKQSSKRDSAIRAIKAVRRPHMILVSSVKAFNELFKGSELCRFFIEILKADDLTVLDVMSILGTCVYEVNTGRIRRVAISNE
jgi:hypothetical protein